MFIRLCCTTISPPPPPPATNSSLWNGIAPNSDYPPAHLWNCCRHAILPAGNNPRIFVRDGAQWSWVLIIPWLIYHGCLHIRICQRETVCERGWIAQSVSRLATGKGSKFGSWCGQNLSPVHFQIGSGATRASHSMGDGTLSSGTKPQRHEGD
jgi:hypothetical protein